MMIQTKKILITGALGQLGPGLATSLGKKLGFNNIITSDINPVDNKKQHEFVHYNVDVKNVDQIVDVVKKHNIDTIVHLAALLSASSEKKVDLAVQVYQFLFNKLQINIESVTKIIQMAHKMKLKLFIPSTIGAFGPDSPRNPTPDICVQRPKTLYGVAKVFMEHFGEYYHLKHGLDFRSLRYPGIISADTEPGGGTTDYAVDIFKHAKKHGSYECYLKGDTLLPMMHVDDCLKATSDYILSDRITSQRTYNIAAVSFTPNDLAKIIKTKYLPSFELKFKIDHLRQSIADGWPQVFDDSNAREHWGWKHQYNTENIVDYMFKNIETD